MSEIKFIDQWSIAEAIGLPVDAEIEWVRNMRTVVDESTKKERSEPTQWITASNQVLFDKKVLVSMHDDILAAITANPERSDLYLRRSTEKGSKWGIYEKIVVCKRREIVATIGGKRPEKKAA